MIVGLARSVGVVWMMWVMLMIVSLTMVRTRMVEAMLMIMSLTRSMGVVGIVWVMLMIVGLARCMGVVVVKWVMLMIMSLAGWVGVVKNMLPIMNQMSSSSRRNSFAFPEGFQAFCKLKKKSVNTFQLCHFLACCSRPAFSLKKLLLESQNVGRRQLWRKQQFKVILRNCSFEKFQN